jgi:hypothetical protein
MTPACTILVKREYFQPSGLDTVKDWDGPKSVAIGTIDEAEITVQAFVTKSRQVEIFLMCELPPGSPLAFSSDQGRFESDSLSETVRLSWLEWTVKDGVGSRIEIPFSAKLKPRSYVHDRMPRTGIVDMGSYETTITLPDRFSEVSHFVLILPAPVGHPEIRMEFRRTTAKYLDFGGAW